MSQENQNNLGDGVEVVPSATPPLAEPSAAATPPAEVEEFSICATVTMTKPAIVPIPEGTKPSNDPLVTLRVTSDVFDDVVKTYPNFKIGGNEQSRKWFAHIAAGMTLALKDSFLKGATLREGSDWQQDVEHEGHRLQIGSPVMHGKGRQMTGEVALMKLQGSLGIGTMVQIPLWHSGIWITLSPPTDGELLNLERLIAEEKIALGRQTNGTIFSNTSYYLNRLVFDFILDHIYTTTVKDYTPELLRTLIRSQDLPILAWGMACAMYPNGYTLSQPCIAKPDACQYITQEHVILSKLLWEDRSSLTPAQVRHMAHRDRDTKWTVEQINAYQSEGRIGNGKTVTLPKGNKMVLRVPTVQDYISAGDRWVASIIEIVNKVITTEVAEKEKEEFLRQQAALIRIREYAHWIKALVTHDSINDEDFVMDDREDLEAAMNILSSDEETVEVFFKEIKKYMDEVVVALVAIPSFKCPGCKKQMVAEEKAHPFLIPVEAMMLFFTLKDRKLSRSRTSETP